MREEPSRGKGKQTGNERLTAPEKADRADKSGPGGGGGGKSAVAADGGGEAGRRRGKKEGGRGAARRAARTVDGLVEGLRRRFGLERALRREAEEAGDEGDEGVEDEEGGAAAAQRLREFRGGMARLVGPGGTLDLRALFADPAAARDSHGGRAEAGKAKKAGVAGEGGGGGGVGELPVKLEICSGSGEWAAAQAAADAGRANWLALELRHDRVYEAFTRMVLQGVTNLALLSGDAAEVLPQRLAEGSVAAAFVNHPEPPQQTGGVDSQAGHLLTGAFLGEVRRVLSPGGQLVIVTDNLWYGRLLTRTAAELPAGTFRAGKVAGKARAEHQAGAFTLFAGEPGPECGHSAQASSYFDRLWQKGISRHSQRKERYMLVLVRP